MRALVMVVRGRGGGRVVELCSKRKHPTERARFALVGAQAVMMSSGHVVHTRRPLPFKVKLLKTKPK